MNRSTRLSIHFFCALFFGGLLVPFARSQDDWQPFPQDVTTANLWSVAYDDTSRALVAVGDQGTVLTYSYDDQVWQPRTTGSVSWLVGVGFGAGRFVVVGEGGLILTSDDAGATWTKRNSGTTTRLNAAAYGGGRWLVVGEQGIVLTSTDGTTWSSRPPLGSGFLRGLAYGQGQFFIGGAAGALYTSTDAAAFVRAPTFTAADIESVAISSNRFWASGSNGLIATAISANAWTILSTGSSSTFRGIAVRDGADAAAVSDFDAMIATASAVRPVSRPTFLATAITRGRDELIAVGFGGGVARAGVASLPTILSVGTGTAIHGTDVRLVASTGSYPAVQYQWRRGDGSAIPGATGLELLLPRVTTANSDNYRIEFIQANGAINTVGMKLRVVPDGAREVRDGNFVSALPVPPTVVTAQADGKLLVAGSFSVKPAGGSTYGLARLNADGSLDPSFRAGDGIAPTQSVSRFLPLADGRIYVLGSFGSIGGVARANLARLLSDGTVDPSFQRDPSFTSFSKAVPLSDGRVFVDVMVDGVRKILRLSATGAIDPSFAVVLNAQLLGVDSQGRVLAISFVPFGYNLVRHRPDGSRDSSYTETAATNSPPFNEDFIEYVLNDAGLFTVAAYWSKFGTYYSLRHFKSDGGRDTDFNPPSLNPYPYYNRFSSAYFPDGSVVAVRLNKGGATYQADFIDATGRVDRTRYATTRDASFYKILTVAPDRSLIALARTDPRSTTETLVRIRPITGRAGRLTNLSARSFVEPAVDPLILGFVTTGTGETRALVRAIGPGLANYQVPDAMSDPRLALTLNGVVAATNDQWESALAPRFAAVGAFPLAAGSRDAALESTIGPASYTAVVTAAPSSTSGTALAELYESADPSPAPRRFINASARGPVTASRPLIVGFGISGDVPITVMLRCAGPALVSYGVTGVLGDPQLTLYRAGDGNALWENNDWSTDFDEMTALVDAASTTGAFALPTGSKDSAMIVTLPPGTYSAVATGNNGSSGTALVEIYEVR